MTRTLHLPLIALALLGGCELEEATVPLPPPPPMEVGGSNYVVWSAGDYLLDTRQEVWFRPGVMKPVIATFHEDSATVKEQILAMRASGQERIALVLWYEDFGLTPERSGTDVYAHIVDSRDGALIPRHAANLRRVVELIRDAGYRELIFRFASQGESRAFEWDRWHEDRYQKNWSFIASTKPIVDAAVGAMPVLFDLDVELGGIHHLGEGKRYATRLWQDYVRRYGGHDSVGFSITVGNGVVAAAIGVFDQAGRRPVAYSVDVYGDEYALLRQVSTELRRAGEGARPVIVQEVYYNDPQAAEAVRRAREELRLNVRYILQWPQSRDAAGMNVHFPIDYSAYK